MSSRISTRNNGNLLYRLRIFLHGGDQRMSNLMIGYDSALLLRKNAVFLLFADKYNLNMKNSN